MKIVHVVSLMSDDGAYGGPLAVATAQAQELIRRGHDVVLAAGWRGQGVPPAKHQGVPLFLAPARSLPGTGFRGLTSPGLIRYLEEADVNVVHVHAGRDVLSQLAMRTLRRKRTPYVVQTHGMVMPRTAAFTRVYDRAWTRPNLRSAATRFTLTPAEDEGVALVTGGLATTRLRNGIATTAGVLDDAWEGREVVFAARLHPRKRVVAFVEMAALLRESGVMARFTVLGPDEGDRAAMDAAIDRLNVRELVRYEGALAPGALPERLRRAAVFVLPSVDEPFPVALLEALSVGVPSICTTSCGIADDLRASDGAAVTDGTPQEMAEVVSTWLGDRHMWLEASRRARNAAKTTFGVGPVVDALEQSYGAAMTSPADEVRRVL